MFNSSYPSAWGGTNAPAGPTPPPVAYPPGSYGMHPPAYGQPPLAPPPQPPVLARPPPPAPLPPPTMHRKPQHKPARRLPPTGVGDSFWVSTRSVGDAEGPPSGPRHFMNFSDALAFCWDHLDDGCVQAVGKSDSDWLPSRVFLAKWGSKEGAVAATPRPPSSEGEAKGGSESRAGGRPDGKVEGGVRGGKGDGPPDGPPRPLPPPEPLPAGKGGGRGGLPHSGGRRPIPMQRMDADRFASGGPRYQAGPMVREAPGGSGPMMRAEGLVSGGGPMGPMAPRPMYSSSSWGGSGPEMGAFPAPPSAPPPPGAPPPPFPSSGPMHFPYGAPPPAGPVPGPRLPHGPMQAASQWKPPPPGEGALPPAAPPPGEPMGEQYANRYGVGSGRVGPSPPRGPQPPAWPPPPPAGQPEGCPPPLPPPAPLPPPPGHQDGPPPPPCGPASQPPLPKAPPPDVSAPPPPAEAQPDNRAAVAELDKELIARISGLKEEWGVRPGAWSPTWQADNLPAITALLGCAAREWDVLGWTVHPFEWEYEFMQQEAQKGATELALRLAKLPAELTKPLFRDGDPSKSTLPVEEFQEADPLTEVAVEGPWTSAGAPGMDPRPAQGGDEAPAAGCLLAVPDFVFGHVPAQHFDPVSVLQMPEVEDAEPGGGDGDGGGGEDSEAAESPTDSWSAIERADARASRKAPDPRKRLEVLRGPEEGSWCFYEADGRERGDYTMAELRARAVAGRLPFGCSIHRKEDVLWLPLSREPLPADSLQCKPRRKAKQEVAESGLPSVPQLEAWFVATYEAAQVAAAERREAATPAAAAAAAEVKDAAAPGGAATTAAAPAAAAGVKMVDAPAKDAAAAAEVEALAATPAPAAAAADVKGEDVAAPGDAAASAAADVRMEDAALSKEAAAVAKVEDLAAPGAAAAATDVGAQDAAPRYWAGSVKAEGVAAAFDVKTEGAATPAACAASGERTPSNPGAGSHGSHGDGAAPSATESWFDGYAPGAAAAKRRGAFCAELASTRWPQRSRAETLRKLLAGQPSPPPQFAATLRAEMHRKVVQGELGRLMAVQLLEDTLGALVPRPAVREHPAPCGGAAAHAGPAPLQPKALLAAKAAGPGGPGVGPTARPSPVPSAGRDTAKVQAGSRPPGGSKLGGTPRPPAGSKLSLEVKQKGFFGEVLPNPPSAPRLAPPASKHSAQAGGSKPGTKRAREGGSRGLAPTAAPEKKPRPAGAEGGLSKAEAVIRRMIERLRSYDEEELQSCFARPVVEVYPAIREQYLKAIPEPMDIATLGKKLKGRKYGAGRAGFDSFCADVKLMIANCEKYNASQPMFLDFADKLSLVFSNLCKQLVGSSV
eukprot:jgi/Tetstr1/454505/TSEL_004031.t1